MASATPPKLVIACPPECSLNPDKIGQGKADLLRILRENGAGIDVFMRRGAEVLGRPIPHGNAQRHLKHYREAAEQPSVVIGGEQKVGDLEILDSIIASGFRNSRNWKPTIKDTLDAMKLKIQITGNSAFEDLIALFDSADIDLGEDEPVEESEEAVLSPDERSDDDEDLAEPLL